MTEAVSPRFSVIVPAFNAEATVASAIASALAQTRQDFELIVVDDGSTDETAHVVGEIPDARVSLLRQDNRGLAAARNAGIAASRGELISFLDSDDLWLPQYLEAAAAAIESTPGAGLAYTDAYAFDPISRRVGRRPMDGGRPPTNPPSDNPGFLLELLKRNFIFVSTTVPRRVLDDVGGFDPVLDSAEDYGLWLQILAHKYRAAWMPGKHALYRLHDQQMSRDPIRLRTGELMALRRLESRRMPTDTHRDVLLQRRIRLEQYIDSLRAESPPTVRRRIRSWAGRLRRRLGYDPYHWQDQPPPEVSEVLPILGV